MNNVRCWWFVVAGVLGLALLLIGFAQPTYPNGWLYVGMLLYVGALIALLCLFVFRLLELLCGLHPLIK